MNPSPNPPLPQSRTPGKIRPTARAWWRSYFRDHPEHEVNRQQANSTGKPKVYCEACFLSHLRQLKTQNAAVEQDALTTYLWDDQTRHDNSPMGWIRGEAGTLLNHLRRCEHQPEDVQVRARAECLNRGSKGQQIGPPIVATPVTQDGTIIVPPPGATQGVQPHENTSLPLPLVDQQTIPPGAISSWAPVGDGLHFSLPPSLLLPFVPRPLHVSFPLMNPESFQVSDTTLSELDLSFRVLALRRLRLFGTHLTGPKQEAVICADISNTVVHPFFVHGTAGLGMHFCANVSDTPEMVRLHAKHAQLVWEQLAEISKGNDANLKAQAFLQTATTNLYGRWFEFSRRYLTRACIALNAAKLRFIPTTGRPPELTEDVFERLAILSQNIYFENYMFLAVDGIEPKMTVRIEDEFRHELRQTYPMAFEICPLTMRTQAILLVKDVIVVISLCSAGGTGQGQWKQICDETVARLRAYSKTLLRNIPQFVEIGDTHGAEILQNGCIGCLAHLSLLCDFVSRLEPNSKPWMDTVCDWSLEQLGTLTTGMSFEEYTYLDLLMKISWERSLVAFDSRISCLPHEESASLRRHREVVAEAWSDFNAKLPDNSPLSITARLVFADGRQEGSRYPNFMVASERVTYGL